MYTIDLTGQTAVITGGGQGIGKATAEVLCAAGANVVIGYYADPQGINQSRAEQTASALGARALAAQGDVRDMADTEQMFNIAIDRFGALDMVVNNAAIVRDRTLMKMTSEEWQSVLDTNLTGVFQVCRAAGPLLRTGGRIVNLASISGVVGLYGQANYAASKAGVIGLTRVLSRELAKRQITVNAVAPGVILTEMAETIPAEVRRQMLEHIPLDRFGEPREVANVILFLCSPLASYITGQTIHINGGWWA